MARITIGGAGSIWGYPLYEGGVIRPSIAGPASISLYSELDGAGLISTAPAMDSDTPTIALTTNRKDKATIDFFKENSLTSTEAPQKQDYENNTNSIITIGADLNKKQLLIYASCNAVHSPEGVLVEYLAAVGYFTKASRNWSTTANTPNQYTWNFTCEKATGEEIELIQKILSNAELLHELGYGGSAVDTSWGKVQGIIANPFADWDVNEAIQQFVA